MSSQQQSLPKVKVFTTGGTIASSHEAASGGLVPALSGSELLDHLHQSSSVSARLEVEDFDCIPGPSMNPSVWVKLANKIESVISSYPDIAGVVVTHGTDTLEETAYFLDLTLSTEVPVVLTGAQRSADQTDSDGPRNLQNAIRVTANPRTRGRGVLVVFDEVIYSARDVTKSFTTRVAGFSASSECCVGYVDPSRLVLRPCASEGERMTFPIPAENSLSNVEMVYMYAGVTGDPIDEAVKRNVKGLVVIAMGAGNVTPGVERALREALEAQVVVVVTTSVPHGSVIPLYSYEGGGKRLRDAGCLSAGNVPPKQARILLMLALTKMKSSGEIQNIFDRLSWFVDPK